MTENALSSSIPLTMRAWTYSRAGPPSAVLTLSSNIKTPTLTSPTDVLVRISHAALNPGSSVIMHFCPFFFRAKPAIPELDFSGTLISSHSWPALASRDLVPGISVFGSVNVPSHVKTGAGTLAEYIVVPATSVVRKPSNATMEEAAGLAIAGCTALLLIEKATLKRGDSVLINGASGGVGTLAVQLAKEMVGESGKVVALCSGRNASAVKDLGADEVRRVNSKDSFALKEMPPFLCLATCSIPALSRSSTETLRAGHQLPS
jgi:reticulon-4-interacting protein 1, mitochondrial